MLSLLTIMCTFLQLSGGQVQQQAEFPGFPWGTSLTVIKQRAALQPAEGEGATQRYQTAIDRLGNADIEVCEFEFTRGMFSGVIIMTRGHRNTLSMRHFIEQRFGTVPESETRWWQWFQGDTYVSLDEDSAGDGYVLWYGVQWQE